MGHCVANLSLPLHLRSGLVRTQAVHVEVLRREVRVAIAESASLLSATRWETYMIRFRLCLNHNHTAMNTHGYQPSGPKR